MSRSEPGFNTKKAAVHIARRDPKLARVIEQAGPVRLQIAAAQSTFEALAESIVYQQLSGKAAATIHGRVCALFPRNQLHPERLADATDEQLRGAGLSRAKLLALRDLAQKTLDGTVPSIRELSSMSDDDVVERLVSVRGVGRWTVEMLLIFRLGRPDVLPIHDYGVRYGFQLAYGKRALPAPKDLARHGETWKPFRTVASWYLWRAVDIERAKKKKQPPSGP